MEVPLHRQGWYKCPDIHGDVAESDEEEKFYQQVVKPKKKPEDWRMRMTSLKERTSYLCCSELFSDFTIRLKLQPDIHYPAHRFVLAMHSEFFQKKLYGSMSTGNESSHDIEGSEDSVKKVLQYIYAAEVPSVKDITELLEITNLAHFYLISSLLAVCEKQAIKLIDDDNACQIFQTAYKLDLKDLLNYCLEYYLDNFNGFLSSQYFVSLNKAVVMALYDIALKTSRKNDFTPYLMKWGRSELERKGMPISDIDIVFEPFMRLCVSR